MPISARDADELGRLGFSAFFAEQMAARDWPEAVPMRVSRIHRAKMSAEGVEGAVKLLLAPLTNTGHYAVGDWVMVGRADNALLGKLERRTLLQRRTEGGREPQLIAANVDTLFIVTSCNADLNIPRLERYLAVANEAGTEPVIVLTKADQVEDPAPFVAEVEALQRGLQVRAVTATDRSAAAVLAPWCGIGQTVALVGSSGVGKSSLLNTLAALSDEDAQETGGIRESDAKGRHTTTARSLHRIEGGGLAIDTPGIRSLQISDLGVGLEQLYAEIIEIAPNCKFRDCTHAHEPGCAVQAAVRAGQIDAERLDRWRKLSEENAENTPQMVGARGNKSVKTWDKRR